MTVIDDAAFVWLCVAVGPWLGPLVVLPLFSVVVGGLARDSRLGRALEREAEEDAGNPATSALWFAGAALGTWLAATLSALVFDRAHLLVDTAGGLFGGLCAGLPFAWYGRVGFAGLRLPLVTAVIPSALALLGFGLVVWITR